MHMHKHIHIYIYFYISLFLFVTLFSNSEKLALVLLNIFTYLINSFVTDPPLLLPPFLTPPGLWHTTRAYQQPPCQSDSLCGSPSHTIHSPEVHLKAEPHAQVYIPSSPHSGCNTWYWATPVWGHLYYLTGALTPHAKQSSDTEIFLTCFDTLFWVTKFLPPSLWCRLYLALPHQKKFI